MSKEAVVIQEFNEKIIDALSNISIKFDELGFVPTTLNDKNYEYFVDWFKDEVKTIKDESLKQEKTIADLEAKLAESEKQVKHWHGLYNNRDKQFQSVRQRYHLLNKLQSNYDKKDKLHLAYMQCAELVEENEKLKQQLAEKERHIKGLIEIYNKNKFDFAIEQLEKVKEFLFEQNIEITRLNKISDFIDNQINLLKGGK